MVGIPAYKRPVNMVFQHYAPFPHLNVEENISYGPRQRSPRLPKQEIKKQVGEMLDLVRLPGFQNRRIWQLSGGQLQRIVLARALINRPAVLLLDEPLAALDRKLRREMQMELQSLQREVGITFVLVTHDQEEALSMSDTISIMRDGDIVQTGTPAELYDTPVDRYVADFVGESTVYIAFRYTGHQADTWLVDDVSVYDRLPHDIAVLSVTPDDQQYDGGDSFTPSVVVRNVGTNTESFDVGLEIDENGTAVYSETRPVNSLAPGATRWSPFPPFPPRAATTRSPGFSKSFSTWPASASITTVPGGTRIIKLSALAPCRLLPSPGRPFLAFQCFRWTNTARLSTPNSETT